jgi:urease accessory protein
MDQSDPTRKLPSLADLRLLHFADSALPIGALAHSFGLESLASRELLQADGLSGFLREFLLEAGLVEAVFCRQSFRLAAPQQGAFSPDRWLELNDMLSARKPARESRNGSASLGQNFLNAVAAVGNFPLLREALRASKDSAGLIHHSTAFGLASGALALDEDRAVLSFLHQSATSLIGACQRLMPLGQTVATCILWNLKPAMIETAERSAACALDDACSFVPLLDWGAMEHPALSTRLFVS